MKPIPSIAAVASPENRPLWSVMIPVYRPNQSFLEETVESVLRQDPGDIRMQIEIVDDHSPDDVAERVAAGTQGRVGLFRRPSNTGMAGNWNMCLERARGFWVHVLHQDDLVLPGFYQKLSEAIEAHPTLGAAYVQHYLIDGAGDRKRLMSQNPAGIAGIVDEWLEYVFVQLSFQTPSVVVRRAVYEDLGGFRKDLRYALDWDMWKRIAASYPIWFEPEPLACYRRHAAGASMDFFASGGNMQEVRQSIELSRTYLSPDVGRATATAAHRHYSDQAIDAALHALFEWRNWRVARAQLREARRFSVGGSLSRRVLRRARASVRRWMDDR